MAIYARYSSDQQREASIDDQLRVCRARAERENWHVMGSFTDAATSGATTLRPGYQAMLTAMRAGKIDLIIAESLDRFSRDLEHIAAFHKQCVFQNVQIFTLAEGEISELHVGLKGVMGALYLKDLAEKTRRGLEGRVHAGRCTGSPAYGYKIVRTIGADGELERGLRAIDDREADIVRRIFQDYVGGVSPLKIAQALNTEGVCSPGGGIWYDASIRGREKRRDGILRNALYIGRIVWRRRLSLKNPSTGERVRRDATSDSFVTGEAPELRIIDDALWASAQARLRAEATGSSTQTESLPGFWDRRRPRHLLSGKIVCGVCGHPFRPTGKDYLGCSAAKHNACSNRRTPRRIKLEAHVLEVLARQLMQPSLLEAFVAAFTAEWNQLKGELCRQSADQKRVVQALDRKIVNLVDVLSEGGSSAAVRLKLKELEAMRDCLVKSTSADVDPVGPLDIPSAPELSMRYSAQIEALTASLATGEEPEALELARQLIDQVIIHPLTDHDPTGVEFIGDLMALLTTAGMSKTVRQTVPSSSEAALALFIGSAKEGPGAEPLA